MRRATGRAGAGAGGLACLAWALFFCVMAAAGRVEGGVTWKYCEGDWEAKISNVTVLPDPVRAGQEINVLIDGEIGTRHDATRRGGSFFSSLAELCLNPPLPRPSSFLMEPSTAH